MNAIAPPDLYLGDTLQNLMTGLGVFGSDKALAGRFMPQFRLSAAEIRALYESNGLAAKAIDLPAEEATANWRSWNGPKTAIEAVEAAERRVQLQQKLMECLKLAARDGGAVMLIGAGGEPMEPLEPAQVEKGQLRFLHVIPRHSISCGPIIRDPWSPWFEQPSEYRLFAADGRAALAVHPSRVIAFAGPGAAPFETGEPWGMSVFQRMHNALRDLASSLQAVAALMQEAKVDVISVPGLTQGARDPNYRAQVIARFGLANSAKSIQNALLLDAAEKWETRQLNFASFPEVIDRLMLMVAAVVDMPVTLLFGRSPAGLNATGTSDLEQFYKRTARKQTNEIGPALALLDEVLIRSALGRRPRSLFYSWAPLWSTSEVDMAKVRRDHAAAVKDLADAGVVDKAALGRAVVNQAETDTWLAGLGQNVAATTARQQSGTEE